MFKKLLFVLIYLFLWIFFFELARVYFLIYEWQFTRQLSFPLILQTMAYGLKMDIAMASYVTFVPCLMILVSILIPIFRKGISYTMYTGCTLFVILFLIIVDAELYKEWGSRIDFTPIKYLSSPVEMWASISHLPIFWFLALFIIVLYFLFLLTRKIIKSSIVLLQNREKKFVQVLAMVFLIICLIVPARGGIQLAPINHSSVYFSNNQFANNAAINASWNFIYSIMMSKRLDHNYYKYMDENVAKKITQPLFTNENKIRQIIKVTDSIKANVIIIIWESFSEKVVGKYVDGKPVVPNFEKLITEGVYFNNCYASGDRTDKGLSAVLSGYPAMPKGSVINHPEKSGKLSGLGKIFFENKYETSFYYGGELEFANIKTYLLSQRFQQLGTKNDFHKSDMNSKWGVHDDVMAKRFISDIPKMKEPFFATWLTLSSHEPFEIPTKGAFTGDEAQTKYLNSLHYTDSCVNAVISELKKMPQWKNTIVIIVGDHGHHLAANGIKVDAFRIPLLWLGGAVENTNISITKVVSQLDIAKSLVHQLNFKTSAFSFSRNLFDSTTRPWSFFTFNDGIGFVTDSSRLLFDNVGKKTIYKEGKTSNQNAEIAKALMQIQYTNFLKQ